MSNSTPAMPDEVLDAAVDQAIRAIPPSWPLANTVAVNPFLGQAGEPLWAASARLARVAGCRTTMPRSWYRQAIADGLVTDADLAAALAIMPPGSVPADPADLKAAAAQDPAPRPILPTVADLAASPSGVDWPAFLADRLGAWAASFFDEGQALWSEMKQGGAYAAWRRHARHDRTPEIAGLTGFRRHVAGLPDTAAAAMRHAVVRLGVTEAGVAVYAHRLLMDWGGWAQLARQRLWDAELVGTEDGSLRDLLAIRLCWEAALLDRYQARIQNAWASAALLHGEPDQPSPDEMVDVALQEAMERAGQRRLAATLSAPASGPRRDRPSIQAAFCIDVRSEVFRRALESVAPDVQTLGFAGFFGLATAHRRFGSVLPEARLPVLLAPSVFSCSGTPADAGAEQDRRIAARTRRAWERFKRAAVSSFAFIEAAGVLSAGTLVADSLHVRALPFPGDPKPRLDPAPAAAARLDAAEAILRGLGLTHGIARLVLLLGHGARVANNPHASALQCGACGGHSGEVNARLVASLLNDPQVRIGLEGRGITVPPDTLFVAGLHDTTADAVVLYQQDQPCADHAQSLSRARVILAEAGGIARAERALSLPLAGSGEGLRRRGRDWAQTRPEWGLAGCHAFIAAPRERTVGRSLRGRAFLHDYDWRTDAGFGVLQMILTAPVVVASWINLAYYGSVVAPETFGAGNKLLHNVTGGIGVLEGNGGRLRVGLPWQSIHDGERPVHEPLRLSVCMEAPPAAIADVLRGNDGVRALFDNRWLHLLVLDAQGRITQRYAGNLQWEPFDVHAREDGLRLAS